MHVKFQRESIQQRAFTFMEILIVIAIIASAYAMLLPNLNVQSTTEVMNKLNRLGSDVRSAFDLAILNNKAYRLVFHLNSGKYWLEETEADNIFLGEGNPEGDPSDEKEKAMREEFIGQFEKYSSLAGETFKDAKGDVEIPPMSPVIRAKNKLQPPKWTPVNSLEWGERELTPQLIIKDIKVEHSLAPMTLEGGRDPEENYAHLYFLPSGYVERATIHLYYTKGDRIDESQAPWTCTTLPYRGELSVTGGLEEPSSSLNSGEE